jgi:DNA-3-methyladenine glycosylase II
VTGRTRRRREKAPGAGSAGATGARRRRAGVDSAAARRHLSAADPVLARVIERVGPVRPGRDPSRPGPEDHYGSLLRAIVGQQLSTKAASAIYGRLLEHFGGHAPGPREILAADAERMRAAAGLSRAKVSFLHSLAEHVVSGELELERMEALGDEDVIAELVAVKGIGTWSAHMFLMFHLERPDVLAWGDLGIRRAAMLAYGLDELPDQTRLEALGEPWRPHRTTACRYLWRSLEAMPVGGEPDPI